MVEAAAEGDGVVGAANEVSVELAAVEVRISVVEMMLVAGTVVVAGALPMSPSELGGAGAGTEVSVAGGGAGADVAGG